jgi:hypothetical protein
MAGAAMPQQLTGIKGCFSCILIVPHMLFQKKKLKVVGTAEM